MNKTDIKKLREETISKLNLKPIKYEGGTRYSFSSVGDAIEIPDLLKVQKESFNSFVEEGLGRVLKDISPIMDHSGNLALEFFDYHFEPKVKYDIQESKVRATTYSKRLIVSVRLIDKTTGEIKEQDIYFGDFPMMTPTGSFIINGAERVIVSQLVRSPRNIFCTRCTT